MIKVLKCGTVLFIWTEESQAFSPEFQRFAAALASDLVEGHRLEGRTVLEVGCGKGDFLQGKLLVKAGDDEHFVGSGTSTIILVTRDPVGNIHGYRIFTGHQ